MTVGPENNVCQNCNTSYTQEHKFCNICGTKIPVPQDWQESAVSDDDIPIQDTRECPFCGGQIKNRAIKCRHCKTLLYEDEVSNYSQSTVVNRKVRMNNNIEKPLDLTLPVIVVACFILVMVSLGLWWHSHNENVPPSNIDIDNSGREVIKIGAAIQQSCEDLNDLSIYVDHAAIGQLIDRNGTAKSAPPNSAYVQIYYTAHNDGKRTINVYTKQYFSHIATDDGTKFSPDSDTAYMASSEGIGDSELQPGMQKDLAIAFLVPLEQLKKHPTLLMFNNLSDMVRRIPSRKIPLWSGSTDKNLAPIVNQAYMPTPSVQNNDDSDSSSAQATDNVEESKQIAKLMPTPMARPMPGIMDHTAASPVSISNTESMPPVAPPRSKPFNNNGSVENIVSPNVENIDYGPYMSDLQRQIKRVWFPPRQRGSKVTTVKFKIHGNGTVTDLLIQESSNNAQTDQAALEAIQEAAPFKPLPGGADDPKDILFSFNCNDVVNDSRFPHF